MKNNRRIPYQYLIDKSPISAFIEALRRRKGKRKRRLVILHYIAFLEFNMNGNPHYHLIIHFADDAYREHDLQQSWKHGELSIRTFASREEYLDLLPYLKKDPQRFPGKDYQTRPPQDWLDNYPKISRVLTSRNIHLGTPRPNRKRTKRKGRNPAARRPGEYNKSFKRCGQETSFRVVMKNGDYRWERLPVPYEEIIKLPGRYLDNKAYLLDDLDEILDLLGRPELRLKKK